MTRRRRASGWDQRQFRLVVLALFAFALSGRSTVAAAGHQEAAATGTSTELVIPRGAPPVIDGTCHSEEWVGSKALSVGDNALLVKGDERFLYLCLQTAKKGNFAGSICVFTGAEVRVLHASAALGTAVYRPKSSALWQLARPFPPGPNPANQEYASDEWRCRDTSDTPEARAARNTHLKEEDWLASPVTQGASGEMEYQISRELLGPEPMRLVITSGLRWPPGSEDDCANERLIGGDAPSYLWLDPSAWGVFTITE